MENEDGQLRAKKVYTVKNLKKFKNLIKIDVSVKDLHQLHLLYIFFSLEVVRPRFPQVPTNFITRGLDYESFWILLARGIPVGPKHLNFLYINIYISYLFLTVQCSDLSLSRCTRLNSCCECPR